MKFKSIASLALGLMLLLSSSCNEEVNYTLEQRAKDESTFQAFKDSSSYKAISLPGIYGDNFVYMKWINKGSRDVKPKQTDQIRMHYSGYFLQTWVKGKEQGLFDTNFDQETLPLMPVDNLILGMKIALQNMVEGDEVGVAIPWYLAYGADGGRVIPGYTSLYFRVKLVEIESK